MQSKLFVNSSVKERPKLRLFCFPYAGGNAATYRNWSSMLPDYVEVLAVQPPGRSTRFVEPAFDNMDDLVSSIFQEIQEYLDIPYIFFGHSLGARVAFEIALKLAEEEKTMPRHIVLSGSEAPNIDRKHKHISHLDDINFIKGLQRFSGLPSALANNEKLMRIFLPMLRADFKLCDSYFRSHSPSLNCHATIFGATKDIDVSIGKLSTWEVFFAYPIQIETFIGDHFFVESAFEDVVNKLTEIITGELP